VLSLGRFDITAILLFVALKNFFLHDPHTLKDIYTEKINIVFSEDENSSFFPRFTMIFSNFLGLGFVKFLWLLEKILLALLFQQ